MDNHTLENLSIKGLCIAIRAAGTATEYAAAVNMLHKRTVERKNSLTPSEKNAIAETIR
jgi:hypothetical protein